MSPELIERFVSLITNSPDNCRITAMDMFSIAATSRALRPITLPYMPTILSYLLMLPVRWDARVWYYFYSYLSMLTADTVDCFKIVLPAEPEAARDSGSPPPTSPNAADSTSAAAALPAARSSGVPTPLGVSLLRRLAEFLCLACHADAFSPPYRVQARELKNSIKALTCLLKFIHMSALAPDLQTSICDVSSGR